MEIALWDLPAILKILEWQQRMCYNTVCVSDSETRRKRGWLLTSRHPHQQPPPPPWKNNQQTWELQGLFIEPENLSMITSRMSPKGRITVCDLEAARDWAAQP